MGINPYDSTVKTGYSVSNTAIDTSNNINSQDNEILTPPSTLAV